MVPEPSRVSEQSNGIGYRIVYRITTRITIKILATELFERFYERFLRFSAKIFHNEGCKMPPHGI